MSVFHEGERAVQKRAGVEAESRSLGRGISRNIPDGAGPFLEAQRLAILAGVDPDERVWASLVPGNPGVITSPDSPPLPPPPPPPPPTPLRPPLPTHPAP